PEGNERLYDRSAERLPEEPKEIKPHPYGVELGRLAAMLTESEPLTLVQFMSSNFSRVSPAMASKLAKTAGLGARANTRNVSRTDVEKLYEAIQATRIAPPATDCICPIGEDLILKGLHHVVPGEFYAAATRPPAVYRGNPFQIEVGLAYGAAAT